jgi:uncharacterized membrane protein YidH (DUF202 family)
MYCLSLMGNGNPKEDIMKRTLAPYLRTSVTTVSARKKQEYRNGIAVVLAIFGILLALASIALNWAENTHYHTSDLPVETKTVTWDVNSFEYHEAKQDWILREKK